MVLSVTEVVSREISRYAKNRMDNKVRSGRVLNLDQAIEEVNKIITRADKKVSSEQADEKSIALYRCTLGDEDARRQVKEMIHKVLIDRGINVQGLSVTELINKIYNHCWGLGPIQEEWDNPRTEEIYFNSVDKGFKVVDNMRIRLAVKFKDEEEIMRVIERMSRSNKDGPASPARPLVKVDLNGGIRVTIRLPRVSRNPSFNIRKPNTIEIKAANFIANKTISNDVANVLDACMKSKFNIAITGAGKVGKTTFLKLLLTMIPYKERIVILERIREIYAADFLINHEDILELEEDLRTGSDMRAIFASVMQASPDRVIMGEALGSEEIEINITCLYRGHGGAILTAHPNDPRKAIEALAQMHDGSSENGQKLEQQLSEMTDIIIHLSETKRYRRKMVNILEVSYDVEKKKPVYYDIVTYNEKSDEYEFKPFSTQRSLAKLHSLEHRNPEILDVLYRIGVISSDEVDNSD